MALFSNRKDLLFFISYHQFSFTCKCTCVSPPTFCCYCFSLGTFIISLRPENKQLSSIILFNFNIYLSKMLSWNLHVTITSFSKLSHGVENVPLYINYNDIYFICIKLLLHRIKGPLGVGGDVIYLVWLQLGIF